MNYNPASAAKITLTCVLSSIVFSSFSTGIVKDSVGLKKEGGKSFVLFKVEPKQTLFSIVKRYGSSVAEFKAANPGISESINVGQTIKIPYKGFSTASIPKYTPAPPPVVTPVTPTSIETVKMVSHVVEPSQGLYAVATKYKITMADLRKWNNLTTDQLTAGQVLIVDAQEYERAKRAGDLPAKGEVVKVEDTNMGNNSGGSVVVQKPVEEPSNGEVKTSSETSKTSSGYRKTVETGLAELIDVEDKSGKYLALHRSAPTGTLVNVKNTSNGQSIWVKVIGKLPDVGSDRVIIKLSPRAFEKLNPSDKRIRTEISYMTP